MLFLRGQEELVLVLCSPRNYKGDLGTEVHGALRVAQGEAGHTKCPLHRWVMQESYPPT